MSYFFKTDSGHFRSGKTESYDACLALAKEACIMCHEMVRVFSVSDGVCSMMGYWTYTGDGRAVFTKGCLLDPEEVQFGHKRQRQADEVFTA